MAGIPLATHAGALLPLVPVTTLLAVLVVINHLTPAPSALMLAFWVAVIWVVVILVRGRPAPSAGEGARPVAPEQIRAQRYARRELDDDEYRRRLATLSGSAPTGTHR